MSIGTKRNHTSEMAVWFSLMSLGKRIIIYMIF